MVDYLIVGSGLAGIAFAETVLGNNKTVFVIDADLQNSSKVAAGLYNPVILKRFSKLWQAQEQLDLMNRFYLTLKDKIDCDFNFPTPILRKFYSIEEQNNWFMTIDKEGLSGFLSGALSMNEIHGIDSPFGYGRVLQTGYVNVGLLLEKYKEFLKAGDLFLEEVFDYPALEIFADLVRYRHVEARHVVFAEGFGMLSNPYFNNLPLDGTKGELFVIKAPELDLDLIVNTSVFILPLGDGLFKVGATYNWSDKTDTPTEEGRRELIERINEILTCDFEIVSHFAGVRPTVKDRKPLLGTHAEHPRVHILNGLGTRGVMLGPMMAKILYESIEEGVEIDRSLDIKRFLK